MQLDMPTLTRTTPIHDRATPQDEAIMEVGPAEVAAIVALIEEGDEDTMLLLMSMWAEHIHMGGENVTFVLNGTAMMPYVYDSIGLILDNNLDSPAAVAKVEQKVIDIANEQVIVTPPIVVPEPEPGVTRVELRFTTENGVAVENWVIMNDVEVFEVYDNAEDANAAYAERYAQPPSVPPPSPPPEEGA